MKLLRILVVGFGMMSLFTGCGFWGNGGGRSFDIAAQGTPEWVRNAAESLLASGSSSLDLKPVIITYPYDQAVFPPEIAAPVFAWKDEGSTATQWMILVVFDDKEQAVCQVVNNTRWEPEERVWERMKSHSRKQPARVMIAGIEKTAHSPLLSAGQVNISTSADPVGASIFYRQVPLPFMSGEEGFQKTRWRLGDIASYEEPRVVMSGVTVCASCHQFSKDGSIMSMELNRGGDNGAQFIAPVQQKMVLTKEKFMSWNDLPRPGVLPESRGLFGKMSPSGRYIAASVHEVSYAALIDDIAFSQLFFPTYGVLATYSVQEKRIQLLPGCDDYAFVHANPNWSPDEKELMFARAATKNEVHEDIRNVKPHKVTGDIYELNRKFSIQFDLYRVPFNKGEGGRPEPVEGASGNGMSNYFPSYSPDGKWVVFTRSKSGIMLQPDSELMIIPAEGGDARRMRCNRSLFNSWHSWAPNSRWLLFSSKVNTPYTEIFLAHVDENGEDAEPVLLHRFSDKTFAANVPEFVNIEADAIQRIQLVDGK